MKGGQPGVPCHDRIIGFDLPEHTIMPGTLDLDGGDAGDSRLEDPVVAAADTLRDVSAMPATGFRARLPVVVTVGDDELDRRRSGGRSALGRRAIRRGANR